MQGSQIIRSIFIICLFSFLHSCYSSSLVGEDASDSAIDIEILEESSEAIADIVIEADIGIDPQSDGECEGVFCNLCYDSPRLISSMHS